MAPLKYKAKVTNTKMLNERVIQVDMECISPTELFFLPGQFVTIKVGENTYRTYSIASDPKITNSFTILVNVGYEGMGSKYLVSLKIGDEVDFIGPSGLLRLREPYPEQVCFFATGTGLAPFIPMLYKLTDSKYKGKVRLFMGVRDESDSFSLDTLNYFKQNLANFDFKIDMSQPKLPENINKASLITSEIENLDIIDANFYLCGNPYMIEDVFDRLVGKGVPETEIIFEKYVKAAK